MTDEAAADRADSPEGAEGAASPENPNSLEALRRSLTPGDLDHTLSQITAAAVEVLPLVDAASITIQHRQGRLETVAPTHEMLRRVDAAQYEFQEGPCYEAAVESVQVVSNDLANDPRFPRYAEVAVAEGIRAQAGLRLFETPRSQGALNLYSRTVGAFEEMSSLGELFLHQAGTAIAYAQEVDDLQKALEARRVIGQAVGILMERYELTDDRAFAFLTRLSSHRNVKLRDVAREIVEETQQRGGSGQTGKSPSA